MDYIYMLSVTSLSPTTIIIIKKGGKLKSDKVFLRARKEIIEYFGETEEVKELLNTIKPENKNKL